MGKRIKNRADEMVFSALQKAIAQELIQLCLVESKVNRPTSPVYNPWEVLLPMLIPVVLGLILIMTAGPIFGLVFMVIAIFTSSNLIKKKLEDRLFDRAKPFMLSNYENFCKLWEFGGVVLINAKNKKQVCIAPDADWQDFIVKNFADFMINKQEETPQPQPEEKPEEETKDEAPRQRRRSRRG